MSQKYIDADEVPTRFGRALEWDNIFSAIPKGKALVLENLRNPATVRKALWMRQEKGLFKNLYVVSRGMIIYIVNPKEKVK